mmetsp:Transcript_395/g.1295  ORF Transcript_395/g.1295 Transcript_395/m.1295 type:complete len:192 (+) Transcript_395:66-641(+)
MRAARAASGAAASALRERETRGADPRAGAKGRARHNMLRIKVISMGDASTGKSCLIKRYCEEKFVSRYIGTIGVDYGVKAMKLGEVDMRVNLWDLAGGDEFLEVRNEFYKDAQGALLVFDCSNRASFDALEGWLDERQRYGGDRATVVVAANKVDLTKRQVSEREGRAWAERNGFLYFEVSAATGEGGEQG